MATSEIVRLTYVRAIACGHNTTPLMAEDILAMHRELVGMNCRFLFFASKVDKYIKQITPKTLDEVQNLNLSKNDYIIFKVK